MFTRLYLEDFRIFKDQTIHIGNTITAIAGHNATGKSTILGILGNTCELKSKFGTTITDKQFKTEFSELFKGSKAFDKRSGDIGTLFYLPQDNDNEIPITLRVTWQKWDKDSVDSNRDRKSVVQGKSVDLGGRRIIKKIFFFKQKTAYEMIW